MGNITLSPCCQLQNPNSLSTIKLIYYEGTTRILTGKKHIAGEIMFEFPDKMVCHADSFFIGHPLPALAIDDELMTGQTYFVLPIDIFACKVLSTSSLSALSSSSPNNNRNGINFGNYCPFEYIKGVNGRVLIKVVPEFITRLITSGNKDMMMDCNMKGLLCSTPELQKHYEQLVGSKEQVWSPKLETISEHIKIRFSPRRFIGLDWKLKEKQVV